MKSSSVANQDFIMRSSTVTRIFLFFLILNLVGCASNCSTNPDELSRLCAARYQVGANQQLEDHLAARQVEADKMREQVDISREELLVSKKQLSDMSLKLAAVNAKTESDRDEVRKIAAELNLKQLDIESREKDLNALDQRITMLKGQKSNKKDTIAQLNQAEKDLEQTKSEIQALNNYLHADLLIKAENALAYD